MADEKESEREESGRNTALLRLPFGLCKRYGIAIQDSWMPRNAWNALKVVVSIPARLWINMSMNKRRASQRAYQKPRKSD